MNRIYISVVNRQQPLARCSSGTSDRRSADLKGLVIPAWMSPASQVFAKLVSFNGRTDGSSQVLERGQLDQSEGQVEC